ncbi:acyl-CoA dehydrogenase family protein [Streptomyces sp. NPDC049954]|uniref:acyl-CoA dehydrogenase family protein n=1 Tax=Streptomyces sp. NPDC049954 TaxID=3155779 RepID=UPI00343AB64F
MHDTTRLPGTLDGLTPLLIGPEAGRWRALVARHTLLPTGTTDREERLRTAYRRLRQVRDVQSEAGGGLGLARDLAALASLHEWTAPVDPDLSTVAGIHYNLFLGSLVDHEGPGARDLGPYEAVDRVGTFLCTEVAHGNDAVALETRAEWDAERSGFVLTTPHAGAQKFMPNTSPCGGPKTAVVAARLIDRDGTDQGVFLFLVDLTGPGGTLPGVRVRRLPDRMGSSVDHCLTSFDRVFVPRSGLLTGDQGGVDENGAFTAAVAGRRRRFLVSIGRVTAGRICMSASAVGSARLALTLAVRYAGHRTITGVRAGERVPLLAHRTHHAPLVEALATTYAMNLLHRAALHRWLHHAPAAAAEAARESAVAKAWITWQARSVLTECRERCGAQGLLANNLLPFLVTGIEGAITAEGDNLPVYAKAAAELVASPAVPRPATGPAGRELTDPGFQRDLFTAAESLHHERARAAMRSVPAGDALERWNAGAPAALRLVEAHAVGQALDALTAAEAGLAHGTPERTALADLRTLFALVRLDGTAADLLAEGQLTAHQVRELPGLREALVAALAPRATALTGAFSVPPEVLDALPLARPDYVDTYDDPEGPWHRDPVRTEGSAGTLTAAAVGAAR